MVILYRHLETFTHLRRYGDSGSLNELEDEKYDDNDRHSEYQVQVISTLNNWRYVRYKYVEIVILHLSLSLLVAYRKP